MAIEHIQIRDFQSLKDVELALGRLTVVVGASNSGKSAVLRAVRAVAANVSSPSSIVRHGKKKAVIRLGLSDGRVVQLERGAALSRYAIELPDMEPVLYAKAGTSVPEDVAEATSFASVEGEDLNFALQFDRPFLLDAPATKVAKVLGDLTGINRIFDAVREANRRRLETASRLRVRRSDVEELRERAQAYADLPQQRAEVERVSARYWETVASQTRLEAVEKQLRVVVAAEQAIEALRALPPVPVVEFDGLDQKVATMQRLAELLMVWEGTSEEIDMLREEVSLGDAEIERLDQEYRQKLKEAGTCPTCGRPI